MNRRLAITVLSLLALLWQGVVAAAMAPAMLAMAETTAAVDAGEAMTGMPCHRMSAQAMAAMAPSAAADHSAIPAGADAHALPDCCAGGHCFCALACGAAALPMPLLTLNLLPAPALKPGMLLPVIVDSAPLHPFRPPIAVSV